MDKESIYELQKIDCNCNNCGHLTRDAQEFERSLERHHRWQLDHFNTVKNNLLEKAKFYRKRGREDDEKKARNCEVQAEKMKFQFSKAEAKLNYGHCGKLNKPVSFIPDTCQLHTQECFEHRKDLVTS